MACEPLWVIVKIKDVVLMGCFTFRGYVEVLSELGVMSSTVLEGWTIDNKYS